MKALVTDWNSEHNQKLGFDQATCDELIATYATKALEFPVLQYDAGETLFGPFLFKPAAFAKWRTKSVYHSGRIFQNIPHADIKNAFSFVSGTPASLPRVASSLSLASNVSGGSKSFRRQSVTPIVPLTAAGPSLTPHRFSRNLSYNQLQALKISCEAPVLRVIGVLKFYVHVRTSAET